MSRSRLALDSVALVVIVAACSARPADYNEDFTEEVERICTEFCTINLACQEPPAWESHEACESNCLAAEYIYNDTACGDAVRATYECIGGQPTCELYHDTNNVHADDYTCKAEKDAWTNLHCRDSDEDPYPHLGF